MRPDRPTDRPTDRQTDSHASASAARFLERWIEIWVRGPGPDQGQGSSQDPTEIRSTTAAFFLLPI